MPTIDPRPYLMTVLVALIAVILRLYLASWGENYDMESWWIVSGLVTNNDSVYANTHRYNYGPIWAGILGAARYLSSHTGPDTIHRFHLFVAGALSTADLVSAFVIKRRFGFSAFAVFLLNPVSLLITGYHSQMDGIAIALALLFWDRFVNLPHSPRSAITCGALLGLSLTSKHILLPFLPWLLVARRPIRAHTFYACVVSTIGFSIFVLSFLPWIADPISRAGIVANVVRYSSTEGASLIDTLWRGTSHYFSLLGAPPIETRTVFLVALILFGFGLSAFIRDWTLMLYVFFPSLLALSSGTQDQYLAVPISAVAISLFGLPGACYLGIATAALLISSHNVGSLLGFPVAGPQEYPLFRAAQLAAIALTLDVLRRRATGSA